MLHSVGHNESHYLQHLLLPLAVGPPDRLPFCCLCLLPRAANWVDQDNVAGLESGKERGKGGREGETEKLKCSDVDEEFGNMAMKRGEGERMG